MYRCLTCGFAQDFDPANEELVLQCHPWMTSENKQECPACHKYLKTHGGRKNGKVWMPDITEAGVLEDESVPEVQAKKQQLDADFHDLVSNRAQGKLTALRGRVKTGKIYGFSVDDLLAQHDEIKARNEQ